MGADVFLEDFPSSPSFPNLMNISTDRYLAVVHLSTNVFAGSDTTAIALRAIIYFLCRHPACTDRMMTEIVEADQKGSLSKPISYKEASTLLPYMGAVVREAMRLHPSVGLLMERHVPAGGLDIHGHHLPAGTVVGINPWVTNRNEEAFPMPESFRPERWLEASDANRKRMDMIWELNFGGGSRKCIGRNISWIEIVSAALSFSVGSAWGEMLTMNSSKSFQSCIDASRCDWRIRSASGGSRIVGSCNKRAWIVS